MADVSVDPAVLRQVGAAVQSVGARLSGVVPPGDEATVQPAGGDGWPAWTAMGQAGAAWLAEIRTVSGELAAIGDALTEAADGYDHTDQHAASRLHTGAV